MTKPSGLRVEHLDEAVGLTVRRPRLSWRLPVGCMRQRAYRIRAGNWDSGYVGSDQSVLVPYGGLQLRSGESVTWTVKVWTDLGESDWADPSRWEMGLLDPADWIAEWIRPVGDDRRAPRPHRVWLLRGTYDCPGPITKARLYATAHGVYEFFVNGARVGDQELTPGFTSYESRLQVQTYDVTDMLRTGSNVLGAVLSGGWMGWTRRYRSAPLGLLAQLDVHHDDGSVTRSGTGPDWTATIGATTTADLWQGQVTDLRREPVGWGDPDVAFDVGKPVAVMVGDPARLQASPAPPVRRIEELRPVAITKPRPDRQVVDLGQNINGWVRLTSVGPAGTPVTLTHGEALGPDGDVTIDHLVDDPNTEPFQTDRVVAAGRSGETFEPRHTTHGFRYVRIEGHPDDLTPDDVTGVVVHTDLRRTGWFECSDERLNRLHEAVVWSFRGNACDIPTDCPTRERAGWTGDWQIFVPAAAFLYDVAGFSTKWLRDLAADQRPDGVVWHCAPNAEFADFYQRFPPGSAGWGDAAVIVPWEIYLAYGDRDLLDEQWSSMTAWVDYAARMAREHRHPSRAATRPRPASHERFLWDTGFHWGEWLEPGAEMSGEVIDTLNRADHGGFATAYLSYSAGLVARIATVLGRHDDARRYADLARRVRQAWQIEFLGPDGTVQPDTQAAYVRALAFDLAPAEQRPLLAERLAALVRAAGTHVGTGFLATGLLLPVLAEAGQLGLAYELLGQDTEPSWLTMIDRGATTVWERWDGVDAAGTPRDSLNHYSKGAVVSFLHRYVAGIRLLDQDPGYRRVLIAPEPGGGLAFARGVHDSPYGRIVSEWTLENDTFRLLVTIPPGTTAQVRLPDGMTFEMAPGTSTYSCPY